MKINEAVLPFFEKYKIGDSDERPWGKYVVIDAGKSKQGEEYCEKIITIKAGQILSLQSHNHRREHWKVIKGALVVILNGKRLELNAGDSIDIPLNGVHAMANVSVLECQVHERQEGICREEDIIRYVDTYGRATLKNWDKAVKSSIERYNEVLADIKRTA
jgi:mannose-6-phosphate isomerase